MHLGCGWVWLVLALALAPPAGASPAAEATSCGLRPSCLAAIDEQTVALVRAHRHNATDPCENFWDHACGDWTAAPFYDHVDTFGAVGNAYAQRLLQELVADLPPDEGSERELLQMLRSYFAACNATGSYFVSVERYLRAMPPTPHVRWPDWRRPLVAAQWPGFHWLAAVAELRRLGLDGLLIAESVGFAANDSRRYVVELRMPDEDEDEAEADGVANEFAYVKYFEEFGWLDPDAATAAEQAAAERFAAEIFELATQLRELRARHRRRAEGERLVGLDGLQALVPNIDWPTYFGVLLGEDAEALRRRRLAVEVQDAAYLREMAALVEQAEARVLGGYVVMRLCRFLLQASPRVSARGCVEHMRVHLAPAMDLLYERRLYGSRAADERAVGALVERLRARFAAQIRRNRLQLEGPQVAFLLRKLERMTWRLGNLPRAALAPGPAAWAFVNALYADADFGAEAADFFRNHWEALRLRTRRQHRRLGRRVAEDGGDFFVDDDARQVRDAPYFVHQRNLLVVPLVFGQPPFFHHRQHPLLQHSLMGWILAHELHHGFEVEGVALDAEGNESALGRAIRRRPRFEAGVRCLGRVPSASLVERMADVNGFQLAYDAYFGDGVDRPAEPAAPFAAEFGEQRLFFLNFAQFFCGRLPRAVAHDRDDVRVVQVVANAPEFADAFGCAAAADENPALKCQMWRPWRWRWR